ncbi:hypothetical protein DVQ06_08405 [Yersinia enterocolitica]|nr:hypothetical protein [Yersinia enterocolitica]
MGFEKIVTSGDKNIAIIGSTQARIKVNPVDSNLVMRVGRMLFLFNALIAPSLLPSALLKIDIAANTKPKRMPATVDRTPAMVNTSVWFIGLNVLQLT